MKTKQKNGNRKPGLSVSGLITIAAGSVAVLLTAWFFLWPPSTPQLKRDPEVLSALDAVFTAINSRNSKELDRLDKVLITQHREGRIDGDAHQRVQSITAIARNGQWQLAAEQFYSFIERQQGR